jgi:hypothetical protein
LGKRKFFVYVCMHVRDGPPEYFFWASWIFFGVCICMWWATACALFMSNKSEIIHVALWLFWNFEIFLNFFLDVWIFFKFLKFFRIFSNFWNFLIFFNFWNFLNFF